MGTCCWLTRKGFDGKQTKVFFYLIASRPDTVLVACIKEASTVRFGKVWEPTLRGGEAEGIEQGINHEWLLYCVSNAFPGVAGEGGVSLGLCPI